MKIKNMSASVCPRCNAIIETRCFQNESSTPLPTTPPNIQPVGKLDINEYILREFINNNAEVGQYWESCRRFHQAFSFYLIENGEKPWSKKKLGMILGEYVSRFKMNGSRGYGGLRLKQ